MHLCEKNTLEKHTVRARTHYLFSFQLVVSIQHGIKKALRLTKLLNSFDGIKGTVLAFAQPSLPSQFHSCAAAH